MVEFYQRRQKVGQLWPSSELASISRCLSIFSNVSLNFANVDRCCSMFPVVGVTLSPIWAAFGQPRPIGSIVAQLGPNLAKIGQGRSMLSKSGPKFATLGQQLTRLAQSRPNPGRTSAPEVLQLRVFASMSRASGTRHWTATELHGLKTLRTKMTRRLGRWWPGAKEECAQYVRRTSRWAAESRFIAKIPS